MWSRSSGRGPMNDNAKSTLKPTGADPAASIDEAITSRRSVRSFLATPVPRTLVEHLLDVAAGAPSGTNMQPWRVYVVAGGAKERLSRAVLKAHDEEPNAHEREYNYYPGEFPEPFLSRRRKVGWDLYGLLGIKKGEKDKMKSQFARNYLFFDAPVGLIFTIDRRLEQGSWLDYGMFLQNIMVAARGYGLHTCPQAAWAIFHRIIREELGVPEGEIVVCGMSLGFINEAAPENALRTERMEVDEFVTFFDE